MKKILTESWFKHFCIILAMICTWLIGAALLRQKAKNIGNDILYPISNNSIIERNGIKNLSSLDTSSKEKLLNLFDIIENEKMKHKIGFLEFYPYYFASSTLLLIISSISIVVAFLTLNKGLEFANPYFKTVFFTLAALSSFYAISPLVFKVETNISNNISKYILYDNLQGEIYDYSITNQYITIQNDTLNFNQFHNIISKKMAETNSIIAEFDYKIIPLTDFKLNQN
jgi:hypothetical protein